MTIAQAGQALRNGSLRCTELVQHAIDAANQLNPALNAFLCITAEQALDRAKILDDELAAGRDRGALHGIPIAHKDLICTKGVRTTSGSKLFADYVPDYDATVVKQLDAAGAVSIGKLGLHECAYGVTSNNPHYGAVRNPWDTERIPGGSSGGSGAAVASGVVFMATGTDTGGSIRIPAAYCGTAGFKPTYGLVSRRGVRPLGFSLDHVGPLARTVDDIEITMRAIASMRPVKPPATIRVGVPENYYCDRIDPEVKAALQNTARIAESAGARIMNVTVPDVDALNTIGRVILLAEASAALENHMGDRASFGPDVLALLDQGRLISATEYINAQRVRKQLVRRFQELFESIDLLLTPTLPIVAPKIGQSTVDLAGVETDTRLATTRFVRGINVLGLPALSLPCGLSANRLPIGAQLIGRAFEDELVLRFGKVMEGALGLSLKPPVAVL
ncbi:MAG: amidase [Acidobacteriaceae bacterium]|nr:amidase [Acidobacteriaceae bacterium]